MLIERQRVSRTMLHKVLIGLGFVVLFLPAVTTNLFDDGLAGYQPSAPAPRPSLTDWFNRSFQNAADQWWKERFGLRFAFVKLDNQLDYSLYGRLHEGDSGLVYGKGGWLYERGYVDAYCRARPPSDEARVRSDLAGIRALQDAMDARGVPFVLLINPSKAAVYPEYIPDQHCTPHGAAGHDYEAYRPLLDEYGIRYVDGYALTQDAKSLWPQTTLFARGGTHWTYVGAYYSAEALLDAARPLTSRPIPPLVLGEVTFDSNPDGYDRDLVEFQNLLFPDTDYPASHAQFSMERASDRGVRIVLVGMSFLQQIAAIYAESGGFDQVDHYWYYHHHIDDVLTGETTPIDRDSVDWEGDVLSADAVILDLNMIAFYGEHVRRFVEDGLAHFAKSGPDADEPARATPSAGEPGP